MAPLLSFGHEVRPAFLQINQVSDSTYSLKFKVPVVRETIPEINLAIGRDFSLKADKIPQTLENGTIFSYKLSGKSPLAGQKLTFNGQAESGIDILITIEYLNGEKITLLTGPEENHVLIPGISSGKEVAKTYTILGIEHILFGIDHLLFVLALIMITKGIRKILMTITAFTLAHSITLSMAVLGVADLPGPPVEAVIALSIVFLAAEILKNLNGEQTLTSKKPWLVAFSFGLLHGFGFAGALAEVGLPQANIPMALAFFNIGVELGQIGFVLVALAVIRLLSIKKNWPIILKKIPAYAIGIIATFWMVERIAAFWM